MHKIELLAPAQNKDEVKIAIENGADAVYIGGESFGINTFKKIFTKEDLNESILFAHENNKKIYVVVSIMPHDKDFKNIEKYIKELEELNIDAIMISDPGVLGIAKKVAPNMNIHMNSQANITNYVSAQFWHEQGVKRVVLTSELTLEEIAQIRANTDLELDIEACVHGLMCISYSGRKLISNYIHEKGTESKVKMDSDKKYNLLEDKRQGEFFPIYEDEAGTFFYNSFDLCMIEHIPDMIKSGITSLKIENRVDSKDNLATIVNVYRQAIDRFNNDINNYEIKDEWIETLSKTTSRQFSTGFYLGRVDD